MLAIVFTDRDEFLKLIEKKIENLNIQIIKKRKYYLFQNQMGQLSIAIFVKPGFVEVSEAISQLILAYPIKKILNIGIVINLNNPTNETILIVDKCEYLNLNKCQINNVNDEKEFQVDQKNLIKIINFFKYSNLNFKIAKCFTANIKIHQKQIIEKLLKCDFDHTKWIDNEVTIIAQVIYNKNIELIAVKIHQSFIIDLTKKILIDLTLMLTN